MKTHSVFIILIGVGIIYIIKDVGTIGRRGKVLSECLNRLGWSIELRVVAGDFSLPTVRLLLPLSLVGGSGGLSDDTSSIAMLVTDKC